MAETFESFDISYEETNLFGEQSGIIFQDFHDLPLALVEGKESRPTLDIIGFYGIDSCQSIQKIHVVG